VLHPGFTLDDDLLVLPLLAPRPHDFGVVLARWLLARACSGGAGRAWWWLASEQANVVVAGDERTASTAVVRASAVAAGKRAASRVSAGPLASERTTAAGKPSQAPQLDRNDSFLPNSEITVSSCIDSRDDFVSS
jgi:hypothetical protein